MMQRTISSQKLDTLKHTIHIEGNGVRAIWSMIGGMPFV